MLHKKILKSCHFFHVVSLKVDRNSQLMPIKRVWVQPYDNKELYDQNDSECFLREV